MVIVLEILYNRHLHSNKLRLKQNQNQYNRVENFHLHSNKLRLKQKELKAQRE